MQFFRASNAKQMKEEGTGLGLFIVNTIAASLDWKISLQSTVNKGTRVCLTIPFSWRYSKAV